MSKYPIYLELKDRRAVVIGAGVVACRKIHALAAAGARVVVVAGKVSGDIQQMCSGPSIELIIDSYTEHYLAGALLAVAATSDRALNEKIYKDCQRLEVLCNVVDQPELCDFFVPAIVKRGPLQIAVGTEGNCPAYAGHIRKKLEDIFTEDHGRFLVELETARNKIIEQMEDINQRKALLGQLVRDESFDYFVQNGSDAWFKRVDRIIAESIGAGGR